ncbi:glycosyltransferase family 2 protein [Leeuwenhoekiella aequorea]|uniref:glycosyltransferase family 2 protein n=1 Tax=Leeuwenhoekiella aequorea TaxID=283736 RepID=UPI00352EFCD3|tara:strand:+ start:16801 stop:17748 length:948 start_codon:yes stop_codon:yes gene_type:complete
MAHNLVSIIIPVFNRASFLEATLNSVKAQNYQNWECIVVDDHSTDDSWKILNTYQHEDSRFKVFKRPDARPKGANACRNFGFEQASGMYVNWFDSDDLMKPTFLQSKIDKHAGGNFDLVLSKTIISTLGSNEYVNEHRTKLSSNLLEDFLTRKITWYLPDPMFKKSFLIGHILFDENLLGGQDRDFFQRVLLNNPEMLVINDYLTTYLKHNDSISEKIYNQGNFKITQSRVRSLVSFIKQLESEGRLPPSLKRFYTTELRKMIPMVHKDSKTTKSILKVLLKLGSLNFETLKNWSKVSLGLSTMMITGKGQKLFK